MVLKRTGSTLDFFWADKGGGMHMHLGEIDPPAEKAFWKRLGGLPSLQTRSQRVI